MELWMITGAIHRQVSQSMQVWSAKQIKGKTRIVYISYYVNIHVKQSIV